jgi:hypothetical protein
MDNQEWYEMWYGEPQVAHLPGTGEPYLLDEADVESEEVTARRI